jgi:hypothetical protein
MVAQEQRDLLNHALRSQRERKILDEHLAARHERFHDTLRKLVIYSTTQNRWD